MKIIYVTILLVISIALLALYTKKSPATWRMNASSNKLKEYQALFSKYSITLDTTSIDLPEVDADPVTVVVQKASQIGQKIIVEDTSLDIEGTDVGIHIKWLLDTLDQHIGKKATWRVLLAYRDGDKVVVFQATVSGTIVAPRGSGGFGFDPVFLPDGATKTLAEHKSDQVNARFYVAQDFVNKKIYTTRDAIDHWEGKWQAP